MLSHYGWLMVYGKVDHPSAEKHGGDVYIHKDEVMDGGSLCPGDIVNFYLYVDEQGLGAEMCRVERQASSCVNPRIYLSEEPALYDHVAVDNVANVFSGLSKAFENYEDEDEEW